MGSLGNDCSYFVRIFDAVFQNGNFYEFPGSQSFRYCCREFRCQIGLAQFQYRLFIDSQFGQIVETDAAGKFALKEFSSLRGHEIIFEDIDGEANGGLFQSDTIRVETLPKTQTEKGNGWYNGKYEVQADIKLKKK